FGVPIVVAINIFPTDTRAEIKLILEKCKAMGVEAEISEVWAHGGAGGEELAKKVLETLEKKKSNFKFLYSETQHLKTKIETIAQKIYGAEKVVFSGKALKQMEKLEQEKLDKVPVCIAKTQYSLTDDPKVLGRPKKFTLNISELRLSNGAGFVVALAGDIMTMPGLPKVPAAENIDVDEEGKISGLF
ncbi:MAG: formate--tetrahydrofolate ligase, partial [Candidatus Pacebacteria bacterium]|nr:formate--tetrahydrofolate ligase [Candidatus Paceibacterota bacterium]